MNLEYDIPIVVVAAALSLAAAVQAQAPVVMDVAPVPTPAIVAAQPASQPPTHRAASAARGPVLADHAYAAPNWNSRYSACNAYEIRGHVVDAAGTWWLVAVDCGYVPMTSRPT